MSVPAAVGAGRHAALPPDPVLMADLTAPTFQPVPRGIQAESKEDVCKRGRFFFFFDPRKEKKPRKGQSDDVQQVCGVRFRTRIRMFETQVF